MMATTMSTRMEDEEITPQARAPVDGLADGSLSPPQEADEDMVAVPKPAKDHVSSVLPKQRAGVKGRRFPVVPLRLDKTSRPLAPPSLQFEPPSPSSFPFDAPVGSVGPSPTTGELMPNAPRDSSPNQATGGLMRSRTNDAATGAQPEGRRSVQFARSAGTDSVLQSSVPDQGAASAWETDEEGDQKEREHQASRDRQGSASFLGKLKALASPHSRSPSGGTGIATPNDALSPQSERSEPMYPVPQEAVETGADADEEDSELDEQTSTPLPKRKRRRKRPMAGATESLPTTPRASRFASFVREHVRDNSTTGSGSRPAPLSRRTTLSDVEDSGERDQSRAGVSEDEGRDRLRSAWRRGIEGARGLSYAARRDRDGEPTERRPGNLRRLTGLAGMDSSSSPFRQRADRHNSASAQKWRQVKAGLKMFGARAKKDERAKVDHQKSAQLMAELLAGAPAALIFASMFQRDEHHHRKVPVLLEQLKINIPEVHPRTDKKGDRDYIFQVDMEYGNGPARMKWTIHRSVTDFVNLHVKYKGQIATDKVRHLRSDDKKLAKIPRFPKSVIPYARGLRGLLDRIQDEEDEPELPDPGILQEGSEIHGDSVVASPGSRPKMKGHKRRQSSFAAPFGGPRRASTSEIGNNSMDPDTLNARQKQIYAERSRQKLETYLQQMIRWLIFRADSTRLCKFLELSAMSIRLAGEHGYQGKQGLLQIASRRHRDFHRKTLQTLGPHALKERHKRRWFLVRHSYVVCVDGPESLIPYDVFLVDSDFAIEKPKKRILDQKTAQEMAKIATENATPSTKAHLIQLFNAERRVKLYARNEKQYLQFKESLTQMMEDTIWSKKQRFGSFAPVRNDVWARWLVDGRDHMWQVSRAIDNARDFVYIHDWWLSPELYMRRPAAISQKWRLDRLLQRKAREGVKIFVIVYRNIESAIPIDSEYTKWSLLDLHENICVQRSPNQFRQNQFFWAHHEKLVVVDNMMAFVGGVDLCFGRWDDSCHTLTDDKLTGFELDHNIPRDSEHCQVWPGKDYSNPRVQDFYNLDRPYEEMYDRTKVPRMPWHDIAMQIVGQPARDIGRHFIQRWNYILRSRVPSRPTPILMPPPEYDEAELDRLGMTGTCQIQILRSCAPWSIGTPNKVEHSIMNAYCSLIKESQHFVYIENQFYISSTVIDGTVIHNKIGDALVERAIRAHEQGEQWQACLVIPLMPGFQNSVDAQDGTSLRLIMACQFRSICRDEHSIWGRLQAHGIDPQDYIRFYSLRQWGKIGPRKVLTTEQLYIHAKCMIVDDRSCIIGSANINERSMLGSRDSEVAAVVTDTCLIPSFMGGKPYEVGEFPHTLRKRLMREHLGIYVDAIYRREQAAAEREAQDEEMEHIYRSEDFSSAHGQSDSPPPTPPLISPPVQNLDVPIASDNNIASDGITQVPSSENLSQQLEGPDDARKGPKRDLDVEGYGFDNMKKLVEAGDVGLRDSFVDSHGREILLKKDAPDSERIKRLEENQIELQRRETREKRQSAPPRPPWPVERTDTAPLGLVPRSQLPELPALDDTDIGGPPLRRGTSLSSKKIVTPLMGSLRRPEVTEDCMQDPLASNFYHEVWNQVAENNTKIYRQVFRCQPDSEVLDWKQYHKFNDYNERFMQSQGLGESKPSRAKGAPGRSGPPGAGDPGLTVPQGVRPKGVLGSIVNKLRPGSKASDATHLGDGDGGGPPGSPYSGTSSVPTVVPSPNHTPLDEKDAIKQDEPPRQDELDLDGRETQLNEKVTTDDTALDEKSALSAEDNTVTRQRTVQYSDAINSAPEVTATQSTQDTPLGHSASQKRRRRGTTKSSGKTMGEEVLPKEEAEELLNMLQGHLVLWPYDWLEKEERGSNWLYNIEQLAPLEIYD